MAFLRVLCILCYDGNICSLSFKFSSALPWMHNSGGVSAASSAKDIRHISNQDGPGIDTYSLQQKMKSK